MPGDLAFRHIMGVRQGQYNLISIYTQCGADVVSTLDGFIDIQTRGGTIEMMILIW